MLGRVATLALWACLACGPAPVAEVPPSAFAPGSGVQAASFGPGVHPAPAPIERRLLEAELRRDPGDPAIEAALAGDSALRWRTIVSLARIGDLAAGRLTGILDQASDSPAWSSLALLDPPRQAPGAPPEPTGEWARLEDAVWMRYALTEDGDEGRVDALLLSIARLGGSRSLQRLTADLARPPHDAGHARYAGAMRALGILCARGHALDERARDAVVQGLDVPEPRARRAALYALGRCARPSAEVLALASEREVIAGRLAPLLDHGSDEEQRLVWRAYAALTELPANIPDQVLGVDASDWRTEVEAVRALVGTPQGRARAVERLSGLDLKTVRGARQHVLVELLHGLRSSIAQEPALATALAGVRTSLDAADAEDPHDAHARALVRCELGLLQSIVSGDLVKLEDCRAASSSLTGAYVDGLRVEALVHMGPALSREQRVDELLRLAQQPSATVAAPALAALADIDDPRASTVLRSALDRSDVGVVSAAASAIAARAVDASKRDIEAVPALLRTVHGLSNAEAVEGRIAAIEALGNLGRAPRPAVVQSPSVVSSGVDEVWLEELLELAADRNVAVRRAAREALLDHDMLVERFDTVPVPVRSEFGAHLLDALERVAQQGTIGLRFRTSAGEFVVDFRGAPASINQANLVDLAAKGYYDGLQWHRVVPDFVVQGGDPRGDGYGGPGHLVPCEWSTIRYERGTVGIALAGKDTGGSQLFITHSEQPHLDARYSVVGHVVEGMEVVDQIFPGDVIEGVTLVEAAR